MEANGGGEWLDDEPALELEADEDGEWLDDLLAMEANGVGGWMDDELGMVVLSTGLVAWVPAQAVATDGSGRNAVAVAQAQNAWVPAEAAARTRWIPAPELLVLFGDEARDLALQHGWISPYEEHGWISPYNWIPAAVPRNGPDNWDAAKASMGNPALYLSLLCLPAQEIARCRCVCRAWRYITSTNVFRRHHHDHHFRMPMPLFFFLDPKLALVNLSAVDIHNRVHRPVLRFARPSNHVVFRVHGSCDGILLLSSGRSLYACNPCTRRWARLPKILVDHDIIGFYMTPGPGGDFQYKVLYRNRMGSGHCAYAIFTLGTAPALAWKLIGRPCPDELDPVLAKGIVPSYKIPPVFVLGFLHWPPKAAQDNTNANVLMFNTAAGAEAFSWVTPPSIQVGSEAVPAVGRQLFEINERLAMTVISFSSARVHVWVKSNGDTAELWSHQYTIHVPVDEIRLNNSCHHNGSVFAVAQDRHDPVQCPRVLLQCDAQGAVLQRYRYQHDDKEYWTALSGHTIRESLLLHPLLMRGREAAHGEPPFF